MIYLIFFLSLWPFPWVLCLVTPESMYTASLELPHDLLALLSSLSYQLLFLVQLRTPYHSLQVILPRSLCVDRIKWEGQKLLHITRLWDSYIRLSFLNFLIVGNQKQGGAWPTNQKRHRAESQLFHGQKYPPWRSNRNRRKYNYTIVQKAASWSHHQVLKALRL